MLLHLIQSSPWKLKAYLCLLGCFILHYAQATPFKDFVIKHLESEQLPQSTVAQMLQDKSGYWWIITNGGISRYDGFSVKTFKHPNLDYLNTQIISICKNDSGDVIAFDEKANAYNATYNGLGLSVVEKGMFWRPSVNGYLSSLVSKNISLPAAMVPNIVVPRGGIYLNAFAGHGAVLYKKNIPATLPLPARMQQLFKYGDGLVFFTLGNLLFEITAGHKLITCDSNINVATSKFTGDVLNNPFYKKEFNSSRTKILYAQHQPYLLMGSSIYSLSFVEGSIRTKTLVSDIPTTFRPMSLGIDSLNSTIAIGTISSGVYFLTRHAFGVKLAANNSYLDNVFYGVMPLKQGWYYSSKGFVFKLTEARDSLVIDNAIGYKGLYSYNGFTYLSYRGKLIRFSNSAYPVLKTICPSNGVIVQMETGPDGKLWLCTKDDIGYLNGDSIIWKVNHLLSNNTNTYIESFKFINNNELWIGTGGGLYTYNLKEKKVGLIKQLGKAKVRNIIDDKNNCYWICTYGQGLYYYSDGEYYHYENADLSTPHTVLTDRNDNLWISSNSGLYRINKTALLSNMLRNTVPPVLYRYSKEDGFLTNEFNGGCHPCGYAVSDSLFLLPSMDGLVYFNPLAIQDTYLKYPVVLDNAEVNSMPQSFLPNTVLPFDFQNAVLTISTPYYGNLSNLAIEYLIKGYDKSWQRIMPDRQIRLKGLPNGNYTLLVRKLSGDVKEPYVTTSIPFSVATPFWKTTWCYLLFAVAGVVLIYVIFKLSLINIMKRKKELRMEVGRRTTELEHSLELLSTSNQKLMDTTLFREQILSFVLHDIRTPLKYISRISESLYKNHQQMDAKQLHEYIGDLHESTIQFTSFSEGFLQWINTHSNKFYLNKKTFNLFNSVQNIYNIYYEIAKDKNILLTNNIDKDFTINTDETILGIVIRNIVDNAIKYTQSGSISISAQGSQSPYILIADTGKGMTEDELAKLKKNISERGKSTSGGLGMLIVNDMLQLLHGNLDIDSRLGQGTTIKIYLNTK
jgi:signal transduction histidine kinase